MTPEELDEEGWVTGLGATYRTPEVETTCTSGKGRLLDYFVVSNDIAGRVEARVDWDSPWAPHRGVFATLRGEPPPQ